MMSVCVERKYFTKQLLLDAIDAVFRENRGYLISKTLIVDEPEDSLFIVLWEMYHNKNEMRLGVLVKGKLKLLDVGAKRYESLPILKMYENGKIVIQSLNNIDADQPYGLGRSFEEKIQIRPVRSGFFRKIVFDAYGGECALCVTRNPLVAAHIIPVKCGGNDTIRNGILLCKNHDHLFEYGHIMIEPDGRVISENSNIDSYSFVRLPDNPENHPKAENFRKKIKLIKGDLHSDVEFNEDGC
ncbi:HNH endonuclease [Thiothrix nivea]|uniref:HNH nuclease domain-containing protein n=1 Tax=Thiothrix nivea (strain ATCC 35100 / DSM 5205 / JP2) TaxID=870187 RepID=A0A656HAN4_THINJ|nr:HNH endonuclease [Thiothrix nivea]EIJ32914.1 hypothetical protein Thini_0253 [Thiothrix nivea DSM 5205]